MTKIYPTPHLLIFSAPIDTNHGTVFKPLEISLKLLELKYLRLIDLFISLLNQIYRTLNLKRKKLIMILKFLFLK